jgi:hypothetical protein
MLPQYDRTSKPPFPCIIVTVYTKYLNTICRYDYDLLHKPSSNCSLVITDKTDLNAVWLPSPSVTISENAAIMESHIFKRVLHSDSVAALLLETHNHILYPRYISRKLEIIIVWWQLWHYLHTRFYQIAPEWHKYCDAVGMSLWHKLEK